MKTVIVILFVLVWGTAATIPQQQADDIVGVWQTEREAQVEIFKQNERYYGKNQQTGKMLLQDVTFESNSWKGTFQAPKGNRKVEATMKLPDANTLILTAQLAGMSRSRTWKRVIH